MMKPMLLWLALCASVQIASGQNTYAVTRIPAELLRHANAVVRTHELEVQVLHAGEAVSTERVVITLLNESAKSFGEVDIYYSGMEKIEDIDASVFDASGNLIRHLKKKDISDYKPLDVFVEDYRVKSLKLPAASFPYTIEYRTVTRSSNLMFYPFFYPQAHPSVSVESARFTLKMPPNLKYRIKTQNIPDGAQSAPDTWTLSRIPAFAPEPFTPADQLSLPIIFTAPVHFEIDGIQGDMDSWESFGKFIYQLNSGRDKLSPATVEKARQMTADCPDATCKVQRLYQYLQDNTRYFNVSLGIGGWQPAPASTVDQYKYGDCKGLSNYMRALLQAVDVPSFYTLVRAKRDEKHWIDPDFPGSWFNHAFLCVPVGSDTLWLECTNQEGICGFNSDFTDDRSVLLITPEGGRLVHTPVYDEQRNRIERHIGIALSPDGSAHWKGQTTYHALEQMKPGRIASISKEEQAQWLYQAFPGGNFSIEELSYATEAKAIPVTTEQLVLHLNKYGSLSGKRMFIPMIQQPLSITIPVVDTAVARTQPVQAHDRGYTDMLDLSVQLPEGYHLESAFAPVALSGPFGRYSLELKALPDGILQIQREFVLNSKVLPSAQFPELITFLRKVFKAERQKLVLVKGT